MLSPPACSSSKIVLCVLGSVPLPPLGMNFIADSKLWTANACCLMWFWQLLLRPDSRAICTPEPNNAIATAGAGTILLQGTGSASLVSVNQLLATAGGSVTVRHHDLDRVERMDLDADRTARAVVDSILRVMGGRFDATTAATPVAAAITTIDFDHERFLGHTIAAIVSRRTRRC